MRTLRIWDLPTRLFHWLLAACVVGLFITGKIGGDVMTWHFRLGYTVFSLLLFRLVWGVVGGHWSRFASFIYAPSTLWRYLRGESRPEHHVGHNPLGALSVFGLLTVLGVQVGSGLISDDEIAAAGPLTRYVSGDTVSLATAYHTEVGQLLVIALVALHIAAILFYRLKKKENLVQPMLQGDKLVPDASPLPASRDDGFSRWKALLIWAACAGLVYWIAGLG